MGVKASNEEEKLSEAVIEAVEEIMRLYKSLPNRPSIDQVEAAMSVIDSANFEEQSRLDEISKLKTPQHLPQELFSVLQQARNTTVSYQCLDQKKEAFHLLQLDNIFQTFDGLIQTASLLVSGDVQEEKVVVVSERIQKLSDDQNSLKCEEENELEDVALKGLVKSSSTKPSFFSGEVESEKFSLMKVAAVIENSAKTQASVLDLGGKLMDQIEWLPVSLGKLSLVAELDLSDNRIMALPTTISNLKALIKVDVHSNQLINLPDSFGELINLTDLDLHANRLKSLPASFGNLKHLRNLDLSSNQFTHLPETIGDLIRLEVLNAETNDLEELPHTIGNCSLLTELRLDFNQLKALPEAVGKLECLEILTLHYNRVKGLPTTMGSLSNLRELDVSFNEIESIPENLCFATSLKKLNVANNFADLRALPRSIGNLEMLEELDISDDQIRVLPDSFHLLSKLQIFRADETPLEVPPRQVVKLGAQAVVEYMADFVVKRDVKSLPSKKKRKGFWHRVCLIFWPFSGKSR